MSILMFVLAIKVNKGYLNRYFVKTQYLLFRSKYQLKSVFKKNTLWQYKGNYWNITNSVAIVLIKLIFSQADSQTVCI